MIAVDEKPEIQAIGRHQDQISDIGHFVTAKHPADRPWWDTKFGAVPVLATSFSVPDLKDLGFGLGGCSGRARTQLR